MTAVRRRQLSTDEYVEGILNGDRALLGRAITLMESRRPEHQQQASELLTILMPHTGKSHRVGITGVPGVGKSTFVETFGSNLTEQGKRVAVLAVDPSSARSGGSILGDKTRMTKLSTDPRAFIRPSPTSGTLGGVASKTRETMLLCEAAGYDVILIETVGVGQSELMVAEMTDFFLVLMLSGAGDELQGIKRGLMELADMLTVNKADGNNELPAKRAAQTYRRALHVMRAPSDPWQPRVLTCSGLENRNLHKLWEVMLEHREEMESRGLWQRRRQEQLLKWMWSMIGDQLQQTFRAHPLICEELPELESNVRNGSLAPTAAARRLLQLFLS